MRGACFALASAVRNLLDGFRLLQTLLLVVALTAVTGCDPGFGITGKVVHEEAALQGRTLILTVFRDSELDDEGFPVMTGIYEPHLVLATRVRDSETDFRFSTLGCSDNVRMMAWIDLDGSEGIDDLVENHTFDDWEEQTETHARLAKLRPSEGDLVEISEPRDFPHDGVYCDPDLAYVRLTPAPFP
jgi:hypothetical protein